MSEEDEEYYDSIDDTELEQCRSFCNAKFQDGDSDVDENDCATKINELIPFYEGNVGKSEIESIKSNSMTTFKNVKLKRKVPKMSLACQRNNSSRSYLTMFYAKNAQQPARPSLTDTGRATCSAISPKSNLSYHHEQEHLNEEGLYDRFLEPKYNSVADDQSTTTEVTYNNYDLNSTLDTQICSVSEALFTPSRNDTKHPILRSKQSVSKPLNVTGLGLGGLGPNIAQEKMEQLRKRQDYGKTVSEKNRIKIMENRVVRQLKQEIRESQKLSKNV